MDRGGLPILYASGKGGEHFEFIASAKDYLLLPRKYIVSLP